MNHSTARLIIANSETSADLYWATRFYAPDPVVYFEWRGKKILVASDLELTRAKKEAEVDRVLSWSECEQKIRGRRKRTVKEEEVLDFLFRKMGIRRLEVPSSFPFRQAEILKRKGYRMEAAPDPFYPEREIKSADEKREIIKSLRAAEAGIQAAIKVLKESGIRKGKIWKDGSVLTSERLRGVIETRLTEKGTVGRRTIVAGGRQTADPHCLGSGPLDAGRPIVLDVFPRSVVSGYYGDVSRTVLKGRAPAILKKMYAAVGKAQENGIRTIRAGVDAAKVHATVCRTLEGCGFKTETVRGRPQGFIHSTGHGLGLDIHEPPRISRRHMRLKEGNVVTVEPGLYYEKLGGIRIEDVVYVTKTGCEILTRLPKVFEIP